VSRSTVLHFINDDPVLSQAARKNVLRVIPNGAAQDWAAAPAPVIAVVVALNVSALFSDPYVSSLVQGIAAACSACGQTVMLWLVDPEDVCRQLRPILHSGAIEGAIIAPMLPDDTLARVLLKSRLPSLFVGHRPTAARASYIDVDNSRGAREAVRHLLRLGCTRIGMIAGPQNTITGVDRLLGYVDALREHGRRADLDLIVDGEFTETGGYRALQQLLPRCPDAVFIANDAMALGALRAIRETGRRVPQDIALVGFDDAPWAAHAEPPLTTVRQPLQRLGGMAVEVLTELIEDPDSAPYRVALPTELVIRSSCGAALN